MRVMMVTPFYRPWRGGLEIFVEQLVAELDSRGHECMVLTGSVGREVASDEVDGIPVTRVPAHRAVGEADAAAVFRVRRAVAQTVGNFAPQVVHAHDCGPMLWSYVHSAGRRRPLVVTLHMVMTRFIPDGLGLLPQLLGHAAWVTGVSQDVVDDALGYAPAIANSVSVIRNGIVPPVVTVKPVPVELPRLACIGRLVSQKGFDRAIDAVALLARRHEALRLTIAGDGPERLALEARAAERGIADRVAFRGLLDRNEIGRLLEVTTAVVMPSRYEGFPIVALEAAWTGRPVIATRAPGLAEAVIDGETGILVGPEPDDLASGIERLIGDGSLARRLGATARRAAELRYSMARCAEQYEAVYARVTDDPSSAAGYLPGS